MEPALPTALQRLRSLPVSGDRRHPHLGGLASRGVSRAGPRGVHRSNGGPPRGVGAGHCWMEGRPRGARAPWHCFLSTLRLAWASAGAGLGTPGASPHLPLGKRLEIAVITQRVVAERLLRGKHSAKTFTVKLLFLPAQSHDVPILQTRKLRPEERFVQGSGVSARIRARHAQPCSGEHRARAGDTAVSLQTGTPGFYAITVTVTGSK